MGPSGVLYRKVPLYCIRVAMCPDVRRKGHIRTYILHSFHCPKLQHTCVCTSYSIPIPIPIPIPTPIPIPIPIPIPHKPLDRRLCSTTVCPQSTRLQDARGGGTHVRVHITHTPAPKHLFRTVIKQCKSTRTHPNCTHPLTPLHLIPPLPHTRIPVCTQGWQKNIVSVATRNS